MIYIGADHGGFQLKEEIKAWLSEWGYAYDDLGNTKMDPEDDYPEFALKVAKKVKPHLNPLLTGEGTKKVRSWKDEAKGILACRSAAGMVIVANKVKGIRAVAVFDEESAKHSRTNNDANVLALSGDWMSDEQAKRALKVWLETEFSAEERHTRRLEEIKKIEEEIT